MRLRAEEGNRDSRDRRQETNNAERDSKNLDRQGRLGLVRVMEKARTRNLDWLEGSPEFLLVTELCEQLFISLGCGLFALFLTVCQHRLALSLGSRRGE